MTWEIVVLIVSFLVPVTVALIKIFPSRKNDSQTITEIAVMKIKIEQLAKSQEELKLSVENLLEHVMELMALIRKQVG